MSKLPQVTGRDMRGVMAYPPTPALPGAETVRAINARWLTERLRWAHEPFLAGQDFMEFATYHVPLEKIRVNEAGYLSVGRCRPPYTENLVPEIHIKTAKEHVVRYQQILDEAEARFGPRKS